jgi:hypothetical protein
MRNDGANASKDIPPYDARVRRKLTVAGLRPCCRGTGDQRRQHTLLTQIGYRLIG